MTVKELIIELEDVNDKERVVLVYVRSSDLFKEVDEIKICDDENSIELILD